jgi:hypothetical protein
MSGVGVVLAGLALIMLPFSVTAAVLAAAFALVSFAIAQVTETIQLVTTHWDELVALWKEGKLDDIPILGGVLAALRNVWDWLTKVNYLAEDTWRVLNGQPPFQRNPVGPNGPEGPNGPVKTPISPIPIIKPIGFATGGIAMRPTNALIGEAGPEAVIPLGRGGGIGPTIVNNINIAGSVISERELLDTLSDELLRRLFAQRQLSF